MHSLRPHRDAAFFAGIALEQREIEVAALEISPQINALVGAHVQPQAGARAGKARQQPGQPVGGEVFRDPEPHGALGVRAPQHVAGLLGQGQDSSSVRQQPLAILGRRHLLADAVQQRAAEIVLKALDLLTDGGLGAVNPLPGPGEPPGFDDGYKAAQQVEIEHGQSIHFSNDHDFII